MASQDSLQTQTSNARVTMERKLNHNLQNQMPQPYLARALVAADPSHPNGSQQHNHNGYTVLQQHVAFFDRNKDGIVYPWESYQGLRAIGFGVLMSAIFAIFANLATSYLTLPGRIPSLLFPIYIKNIHKGKHGSDTECYDTEGRFDPAKFDAIFSKYAVVHRDALSFDELNRMLKANRNAFDFIGWFLASAEWLALYTLLKDEKGLVHREIIRGMYDGSVFERLESDRASLRQRNKRTSKS